MKKPTRKVARRPKSAKVPPRSGPQTMTRGEDLNPAATALFWLSPRFRKMLSQFDQPFKDHPWIYIAISRIMANISQVPFLIQTGSRKDPNTLESGPWVELFERINPHLNTQTYFDTIIQHLKLSGFCMVVKESETDRPLRPGEIPFELWPMNGSLFEPLRDKETKALIAWEYTEPNTSKKLTYLPHQVIPIMYPDPDDPLQGLGPMRAALMTARSDYKARQFNEAFFDNDATPGGILKAPRLLTPKERDQVIRSHEDEHLGAGRQFRMKLLEGGFEWIPNTVLHKDMQFAEKAAWDRDEILAIFGVPKSEVGLEQPSNMITGAGNVSTDARFWRGTLLPDMVKIENAHYRHLFKDAGKAAIWGAFDRSVIDALQPNLKNLTDIAMQLRQLGYSTNEINERLQLGMPEIEGGDFHFIPVGMTPIEDLQASAEDEALAEEEDTPPAGAVEDPADEEADAQNPSDTGRLVQDNLRTLEVVHELYEMEPPRELDKGKAIRQVKNFFRARSPKRLKQWGEVMRKSVTPYEPRFRSRLKRYFFLLRNEQIKRLSKLDVQKAAGALVKLEVGEGHEYTSALEAILEGRPNGWSPTDVGDVRENVEEVLFPIEEWNGRMKSMHHKIYMDVSQNAYDKVFKEIGGSFKFDESDLQVVELVSRREDVLVKANVTIRRRVAREIEEGLRAGENVSEIQNRIRTAFQGFSAARSLRIARTEVAATTNQSRFDAMETEGVDRHQWLTAGDEAVRESHAALDGAIARIGERFQNGLVHPNDPDGPPEETINCRCVAVASE